MSKFALPGLQRHLIQVQSHAQMCVVTTRSPVSADLNQYRLSYNLLSPEALILAVLLLKTPGALMYQRFWRSAAASSLVISLSFFPLNWPYSPQMHGRWRLKPELSGALPDELVFLRSGRCAGTVDI